MGLESWREGLDVPQDDHMGVGSWEGGVLSFSQEVGRAGWVGWQGWEGTGKLFICMGLEDIYSAWSAKQVGESAKQVECQSNIWSSKQTCWKEYWWCVNIQGVTSSLSLPFLLFLLVSSWGLAKQHGENVALGTPCYFTIIYIHLSELRTDLHANLSLPPSHLASTSFHPLSTSFLPPAGHRVLPQAIVQAGGVPKVGITWGILDSSYMVFLMSHRSLCLS